MKVYWRNKPSYQFYYHIFMSDTQNSRIYGIAVTLLLALAAGLGFFFWQKSQNYLAQSEKIEAERVSLEKEKLSVEAALDSLAGAYEGLRTENETLNGKVSSTAAIIQKKEILIRQIRNSNAKDIESLRAQVADLQREKISVETIVTTLRAENEQLKLENQRLTGENEQLKGNITDLNTKAVDMAKQLEEQIRKTQSATFKASSFRVELEKRGDRLTTKARKAREVFVSFDLADVPTTYHGPQKLYMVITDDKGNPIMAKNPIKATVFAPSGPVEIIAQETKDIVLENTQRHSFNHKFDERLKSGNYVVAIYCEKGLLGASSFRLV